mmetsp:Transcript_58889/g.97422  ORF Transcript_58889/g.97422 Transcript_58889/m.97422 type:complete len:449 (+) Transcript_58889:1162-2508(+)
MVGRLVQQQNVGLHKQCAGQRHTHAPATRQSVRWPVVHGVRKAQAQKNLLRLVLDIHAAEFLHLDVQLGQLCLRLVDFVRQLRHIQRLLLCLCLLLFLCLCRCLCLFLCLCHWWRCCCVSIFVGLVGLLLLQLQTSHLLFQYFLLVHQFLLFLQQCFAHHIAREHVLQHRGSVAENLLLHVQDFKVRGKLGNIIARHSAEQCGLARAIETHKTIALSFHQFNVNVFEQDGLLVQSVHGIILNDNIGDSFSFAYVKPFRSCFLSNRFEISQRIKACHLLLLLLFRFLLLFLLGCESKRGQILLSAHSIRQEPTRLVQLRVDEGTDIVVDFSIADTNAASSRSLLVLKLKLTVVLFAIDGVRIIAVVVGIGVGGVASRLFVGRGAGRRFHRELRRRDQLRNDVDEQRIEPLFIAVVEVGHMHLAVSHLVHARKIPLLVLGVLTHDGHSGT